MLYELIPNLKSNRLLLSIVKSFFKISYFFKHKQLAGILMWEEFIDMGIQIDYHELETRQRTLSFDDPTSNLPVVQQEVQRSNIKPSQHLKQRLYSKEKTQQTK
jgi:hypothetical protein